MGLNARSASPCRRHKHRLTISRRLRVPERLASAGVQSADIHSLHKPTTLGSRIHVTRFLGRLACATTRHRAPQPKKGLPRSEPDMFCLLSTRQDCLFVVCGVRAVVVQVCSALTRPRPRLGSFLVRIGVYREDLSSRLGSSHRLTSALISMRRSRRRAVITGVWRSLVLRGLQLAEHR